MKCLIAKEDLQYIDKTYKGNLEDFERIKKDVSRMIQENAPNIHLIQEWKANIRETLVKVKMKYIEISEE